MAAARARMIPRGADAVVEGDGAVHAATGEGLRHAVEVLDALEAEREEFETLADDVARGARARHRPPAPRPPFRGRD